MQIHRKNALFRIVYAFVPRNKEPARVYRCVLVVLFPLMLVPWVLANLIAWIVLGLVLGVLAQAVVRTWLFVVWGEKLVYTGHVGEDYLWEWLVARHALCKLCVFGYERRDIHFFDFLDNLVDFPRSPILFLTMCVLMFSFVVGSVILCVMYIPDMFWMAVGNAGVAASFAYKTVDWWGSAIGIAIASILLYYIVQKSTKKILSTESGKMLASHFKEWKSAHCPVYEVVE